MNQDSKDTELTDEDLQQVSGGVTAELTTQQTVAEQTVAEQTVAERTLLAACATGQHIKKVVVL
jgi:bacteriocin-like protein